jgi:hypothetical protein
LPPDFFSRFRALKPDCTLLPDCNFRVTQKMARNPYDICQTAFRIIGPRTPFDTAARKTSRNPLHD